MSLKYEIWFPIWQMKRVKGDKDFINRFKAGAQAAQAQPEP